MFAHACTCVRCAFADISSSYDLIAPGLKRQRVARVMKGSPLRYPEPVNFISCHFCQLFHIPSSILIFSLTGRSILVSHFRLLSPLLTNGR